MLFDEISISIRYAETDQMKVVYYSEYFKYFEEGRASLLRNYGLPYSLIVNSLGYYLPVIEAYAKYLKPALFEDTIIIRTSVQEKPQRYIRFDSKIIKNSEIIIEGFSKHCFLKIESNKISTPPPEIIKLFK